MTIGVQIVALHFVATLEAERGHVIRVPPILYYMLGWTGVQVVAYCTRKGWTWERLP